MFFVLATFLMALTRYLAKQIKKIRVCLGQLEGPVHHLKEGMAAEDGWSQYIYLEEAE